MIITTGLQATDLTQAVKIGQGEWADVYLLNNKVYRVIFQADSTLEMLNKVIEGSKIQNSLSAIAPEIYSVGLRRDGRIWVEMEYLADYAPIYETKADKNKVLSIGDYLKKKGIAHNDINTGNLMINPNGEIKVIDFDTATKKLGGEKSDRVLLNRIASLYAA